ncbi:hypothetical protein KFK09_004548 [Dendrobium nobile]|uniref:Retrovirus-related Pol polyprotein from transposon TNT 1-94-like beta-barrel domain-containing protein n=1 Tax=Dendrobium nobile TaxID=94219 RepID=A0A8T3C0R4_DENNO|nr:hypothetical protein KFK09_004548 [Dendrobium nobile]
MADQDSVVSSPPAQYITSGSSSDYTVPAPLKFLISNLKTLVPHPLSAENYHIWRIQILQHFSANGFSGYLTGNLPCPSDASSNEFFKWTLIDRNLISALFSTISPAILPHILSCPTAQDVWKTLKKRIQPNIRSRVIQLKNELHTIQMGNSSMQQYLMRVKNLVDNISVSESQIDTEDILLYILNGLPSTYNSFKTAIRTSLNPIDLDTLYSLLCSEEIAQQQESQKDASVTPTDSAFYANRTNWQKGNSNNRNYKNRKSDNRNTSEAARPNPSAVKTDRPSCQICGKTGHIVINCWHRCNFKYAPTTTSAPRAYLTQQSSTPTNDWIMDSGASSHLTPDLGNLQQSSVYNGPDTISTTNGSTMSIQNSGQGLLPLPDSNRKLYLRNLLHVPSLTHNLLSISKLTSDNKVSICFDANGFVIKDVQDQRPLLLGQLCNGLYRLRTVSTDRPTYLLSRFAIIRSTVAWQARTSTSRCSQWSSAASTLSRTI